MKTLNKLFTFLSIVAVMVFTSCSSNDSDVLEGDEELSQVVMQDFVENIQSLAVPAGLSSSNNQYAQQANAQFEILKTLGTSYATLFAVPTNAISAKTIVKSGAKSISLATKTYTWSADGVTVNYTITENSDRYTFVYSVVSSSFTGKFMDGYQLKDGSYAEATIYGDNQVSSTIKWWINANTAKIELATDNFRMILESNTIDNSGTLEVFESNNLYASYSWNSNGTGSYTDHINNRTYTW